MANGSMSTQTSNEGEIRKAMIEADLVDCIVALPGQLFFTTQIPVCLWFLSRNKKARVIPGATKDELPTCLRDHQQETLFIDARKMGALIDRTHRELTKEEILKIANTYHAWRLDMGRFHDEAERRNISLDMPPPYANVAGFCKSITLEEIRKHDHILTPGRYVGAVEVEDDDESFEEKMPRLVAELRDQLVKSARLEKIINANLKDLGYAS
jgi:type I restriction enzyme M protein